jgi:hypothetical protein
MAADAPPPIAVEVIAPSGVEIDGDAVAIAIARELGRPVTPANATRTQAALRIVIDAELRATVYYHEGEEDLTRTITLPPDPERAVETLALLAGNLARDQVLDLARQFARATDADRPADAPPPSLPPHVPTMSVTSRPAARPVSLLPPEARYRGRLGIYAMVGAGSSFQGSPIVPVVVGLALRWRLASVALEGLGGWWSVGYVGADLAVMLHHTAGPLLLGGGVAGGAAVALADHNAPLGLARAFMRLSWAARPSVDLFAQLDFGYGRDSVSKINQEALMLNLGVQLRLLR